MKVGVVSDQRRSSERGSSVIWLILLLVLAAIGFIGWYVYHYRHLPPVIALPANCQTPELNLSIGPSGGAAGTIYTDAVFTNQSLRTCTVNGYPGIALLDAHNAVLGTPATHNPAFPATTITLHPGDSAHAAVGFPQPANFAPGVCSATSANLRATPPSTFVSLETPLARQYCPGFSVTVIQPGA